MRVIIQLLLIAAILLILIRMWRRTSAGTRVAWRLLLILFMTIAVVVILAPGLTSQVANAIGVGRGTDLVLYATVIVVLYRFVDDAIWRRDSVRRVAEVVREQALLRAKLDEVVLQLKDASKTGCAALPVPNSDVESATSRVADDSDQVPVKAGPAARIDCPRE